MKAPTGVFYEPGGFWLDLVTLLDLILQHPFQNVTVSYFILFCFVSNCSNCKGILFRLSPE